MRPLIRITQRRVLTFNPPWGSAPVRRRSSTTWGWSRGNGGRQARSLGFALRTDVGQSSSRHSGASMLVFKVTRIAPDANRQGGVASSFFSMSLKKKKCDCVFFNNQWASSSSFLLSATNQKLTSAGKSEKEVNYPTFLSAATFVSSLTFIL